MNVYFLQKVKYVPSTSEVQPSLLGYSSESVIWLTKWFFFSSFGLCGGPPSEFLINQPENNYKNSYNEKIH